MKRKPAWAVDYIVKRPLESPRPFRRKYLWYICVAGYDRSVPEFDLRGASTPESVHNEIEKDHRYEWLRHY